MSGNKDNVKVGSRKSQLALIQTNYVISQLQELYPKKTFEIVKMSTMGDKILDKPLPKIGEKSLFTKELEIALEQQDVDFVVHSLKDLPTTLPEGMCIGAIGKREDPRDAVVLHEKYKGNTLCTLPKGSTIGTSSLRRTAQLHKTHPHLHVVDIRGNLNTRLAKLDKGDCYSAIVLAAAGLSRMGWSDRLSQNLEPDEMLYAVGQGALAVECREDDFAILRLLESLQHGTTTLRCLAERSFLKTLGGGCSAPVAVQSELSGPTLSLTGAVWSLDGKLSVQHSASTPVEYVEDDDGEPARKCPYRMPRLFCSLSPGKFTYHDLEAAEKLGQDVAMQLVERGALDIMSDARQHIHGSGDESSQLESLFHLAQTKQFTSDSLPCKASHSLPNETLQNKASHSLSNETLQNKASHSLPNETLQNKASHSLPTETLQNKASHSLPTETLQNKASHSLPTETLQNKASHSLPTETLQNKASHSLPNETLQNKASHGLPNETLQNKVSLGLPNETLQNKVSHSLPNETLQNKASHSLPNETLQNKASHSLPKETLQNKASHSLPNDTLQNKASHSLPNETLQNKASHSLPNETLQNKVSLGLPNETLQNKVSHSLPNKTLQNKASHNLPNGYLQNKAPCSLANIVTHLDNDGTKECSTVTDHKTNLHNKALTLCRHRISVESTNGAKRPSNGMEHANISHLSDTNDLREVTSTKPIR